MSLEQALRAAGAVLEPLSGVLTPQRFTSVEQEVRALRSSVAVSATPHAARLRVSGEGAFDALDHVCPADMYLRDGRIRHTLLLREDGRPLADLYLCCDDEAFLLLAEGPPAAELVAHLRRAFPPGADVAVEDLGASHELISLNGPFAWELLAALEGQEIIGFPYLSFYSPAPNQWYFRAGKTGEYGYDLLVPRDEAGALWERIVRAGAAFDLVPAGVRALRHCALENWFFDIHCEGAADLTPIELQLQWRISARKEYVGAEALRARRAAGVTRRVTALQAEAEMAPGDAVTCGGDVIGKVLWAERSITLGEHVGVGLLEQAYAHSGIDRYAVRHGGVEAPIRTVSAPFVNNLSLFVHPQRHTYARRAEIPFPGAARPRAPAPER